MKQRVLVLGVSGMLGHEMFRVLSSMPHLEVFGAARSGHFLKSVVPDVREHIFLGTDVLHLDSIAKLLEKVRPSVIVNCVGLVKQLESASDPLIALPINAIFPHQLARLAALLKARVIHISTDCVFSGDRGAYREDDIPDAADLYGRSKLLGELTDGDTITLRTSIIGRELQGAHSLVDWFLHSTGSVKGFSKAVFSGLTTHELAKVVGMVIGRSDLRGLWHVSAAPIDKYSLLRLLNEIYKRNVFIEEDAAFRIDRSLDSTRFTRSTGYVAPSWAEMIRTMHTMDVKEKNRE